MEKLYGNYLGICVCNTDPEQRGRVQIFIPHILPALDERWNKEGEDKFIECTGDNIELALEKTDIDQLKLMLPWAEAAAPIFGNSVSGHYNDQSGSFNQTYGTETEAAAANASGPASGIDHIFNSEARRDANGNVQVYDLPSGDGGGSYEVAGINERYHPEEAAALRSLIQQGNYAEAEARAKNYIATYTNNVVGLAANGGSEYALRDAAFNRGLGGANWIAKYAAGVTPNTKMNSEARQQIIAAQQSDPQGFLQRLREGAERYELDVVGLRPQFIQGLRNRWDDRLTNSLSLLNTPTGINLNDPTSGNYAPSSNPPQPSPFLQPNPSPYIAPEPSEEAILSAPSGGASSGGGGGGSAPTQGSYDDFFNSSAFKNKLAARGNEGVFQTKGGSWKNGRGTTLCAAGASITAGTITNNSTITNARLGTASSVAIGNNNALITSGMYDKQTFPSNYAPQNGDVVAMQGGSKGYGHMLTFLNGKWYAHKSGDYSPSQYLASGNYYGAALYRLTPEGIAALDAAGWADGTATWPADPTDPANDDSEINGQDTTWSGNMVRNPTSTQPTATDTTGMPQGLFSIPNPGAMLWVFFRGGDPLYPVYFAASYGASEWGNAYKSSSPGAHYPNVEDTTPRNQAIFRPNQSGGLTFTDTITDQEDCRSLRMFHANGAHMEFNMNGSVLYSPNEHMQQVAGNSYNGCLNRENWTQGFNNDVTIGDRIKIVGNASPEALAIIEEHASIVKEINKNMLKG